MLDRADRDHLIETADVAHHLCRLKKIAELPVFALNRRAGHGPICVSRVVVLPALRPVATS